MKGLTTIAVLFIYTLFMYSDGAATANWQRLP